MALEGLTTILVTASILVSSAANIFYLSLIEQEGRHRDPPHDCQGLDPEIPRKQDLPCEQFLTGMLRTNRLNTIYNSNPSGIAASMVFPGSRKGSRYLIPSVTC